jgi:hypothetical protein
MARRTALAPVLDLWGGFFPCLAFMDGAETLLLWWNSTCVNGPAFPGFGGWDRCSTFCAAVAPRRPKSASGTWGRAPVDAGLGPVAWPRWRQTAVPFGKRNP